MLDSYGVAPFYRWEHSVPLPLTAGVAIGAIVCLYLLHAIQSPLSTLPGPWYSTLTSLVLLAHEYHGSRRLYVHELHQKYGPVVRLGPKEVSFMSAGAIKSIYGTKGYAKPRLFDLFTQHETRNIFTLRGKAEHSQAKRRFAEKYSNSAVLSANNVTKIKERSQAFLDRCVAAASAGRDIDIYKLLHAFALDCVSHVLFAPNGTTSLDDPDSCEMVQALSYHDSRKGLVLKHNAPLLHNLWALAGCSRGKESCKVEELVASNIDRSTELADFTIATKLKQYPELSSNEIFAECADHLFAGVETTGDTLCFLMWHISQPAQLDIQRKLQRELREALAEDLSDAQIHQLPYLNAVVDEALRLFTAAANYLPRETPPEGVSIDGHFIPGGCTVSCQPYTVHRCEGTYPDADIFSPDRWLAAVADADTVSTGAKTTVKYIPAENHPQFLAFGSGPRSCIGKHLARAEMKQLLFTVYSRYSTFSSQRMHDEGYSMEMGDQLLTVRPRDTICLLVFEEICQP